MNKKLLFLLVLLLTAATGAWATDYTTLAVGDVIKVGDTFSPTADVAFNDMGVRSGTYTLMRADVDNDGNVTEKTDGAYYVFKFDSFGEDAYMHFGKAFAVTAISDGLEVTNIETGKEKGNLYYTLAVHEPAAASGYTVSLKDGVKDAGKWTVKAGTDGSFQSLPLKGVKAGTKVKLKYDGDRSMLKGVTATSDAAPAVKPAATVTTAPTGAEIVGVGKTTALVSGGVADGGTLMYQMTTTNTKPTSTVGFSATVPTAQTITASGKVYVWYYVKADDTHSDSEIAATAIEVPVADIVWDVTNISNLYLEGDYQPYEKEGVTLSGNAGNMQVSWYNYGDPTQDGIGFIADESGGFTFTAPTGKAFTKIEMKALGSYGWETAILGTGWAFNADIEKNIFTVTWTGSAAASTVDLLKDDIFAGAPVKSIAFYLSE